MFSFLRSFFPTERPTAQPDSRLDRLNEIAPLIHEAASANDADSKKPSSFVYREAVLNRSERIAGYEFSLHRRLHSRFTDHRIKVRRVYDDLLIRSLASFKVEQLLGHRLAFVDVSPTSLDNPQLASLSVDNTVLMLDLPEDAARDPAALTAQLASVIARGFRIGCRIRPQLVGVLAEVAAACDFMQVLATDFDGIEIASLVSRAKVLPRSAPAPLEILASDINTFDDFQLCFRAGFDFFQGPFVTSREHWHPPKSELDRANVIHLLNELRGGAENAVLATLMRQDPVLSYKMLRYINSPAMGLRQKVTALDQALVILGREKFYRWLSLLLFDVRGAGFGERALIEQALVRARLMERLGCESQVGGLDSDLLFLTGLFSLLDQMMGQPIEVVLSKVTVPEEVQNAVLAHTGPFAPFLLLGVACESGGLGDIANLASQCAVDAEIVNRELLAALIWAQEVGEMID